MSNLINKDVWLTRSPAFQFGNIGAEANRFLKWLNGGDLEQADESLIRLLELIDFSAYGENNSKAKRRELLRLREIICALRYDYPDYQVSSKQILDYFIPFAIMARRNK